MSEALLTGLAAFGLVFVAELGDKTQFLSVGFGSQYRLRTIAVGLFFGYGLAGVLAVSVGGLLGSVITGRPIEIASGVMFLAFAVGALRSADTSAQQDRSSSMPNSRWIVAGIAGAIFVGELGDKTQIATASIAAQSDLVATWIGATLGATSSGLVGAAAGRLLTDRVGDRGLHLAAAGLFAAFGTVLVLGVA